MSLQRGTQLISLALLFNRATGVYGLLAATTGYGLSALQLSLSINNVLVLAILVWCIPHIRKQTPLQNLVLAWLYLVDTAVSAAFTVLFAANWFLTATPTGNEGATPGDGETMDWMTPHEAAVSLTLVIALTLARLYFTVVVMAHARMVLQRHAGGADGSESEAKGVGTASPFALGAPAGRGWRGKAGRALVYVGQEYWLGASEDNDGEARAEHSFAGTDAAPAEGL